MNKPEIIAELKKLGVEEVDETLSKKDLEKLLVSKLPPKKEEKDEVKNNEPEKKEEPPSKVEKLKGHQTLEVVISGSSIKDTSSEKVERVVTKTEELPEGAVGVWVNGKFVRAYSDEVHGETWLELAEAFAAKSTFPSQKDDQGNDVKPASNAVLKVLVDGGSVNLIEFREVLKRK